MMTSVLRASALLGLLAATLAVSAQDRAFVPPPACTSDDQCDDGAFCNGQERCAPGAAGADPRGCVAAAPACRLGQLCNERRRTCDLPTTDADGDGFSSRETGGDDCDDRNPNRFPGNVEVCDAGHVDEDCDPTTFGARDRDGDGHPDASCKNIH